MNANELNVPCLATLAGESTCVAFHPTAPILATGQDDGTVKLWRLSPDNSAGACVNTLRGHTETVTSVAFHPTGTLLATGSDDNAVKLWRLSADNSSATCVATLTEHNRPVDSVAFDPTGTLLASGSSDRTVKLWRLLPDNLEATTCVNTLMERDSGWVHSVAFDPTGTFLATGCQDVAMNVQLWRLSSMTCVNLMGHSDYVYSVAFHPTAPLLATGSEDSTAKLWLLLPDNLEATACVATLRAGRGEVTSLGFDPMGTVLATGNFDGTKLWDCRQFQRKNVADDFGAMQRELAKRLGYGDKKHVDAIVNRVERGEKGDEGWVGRVYGKNGQGWGVDPDVANWVKAHKKEKKEKKDGGSRARLRSKSKSKSKRMKRKCTTLKRKSHK